MPPRFGHLPEAVVLGDSIATLVSAVEDARVQLADAIEADRAVRVADRDAFGQPCPPSAKAKQAAKDAMERDTRALLDADDQGATPPIGVPATTALEETRLVCEARARAARALLLDAETALWNAMQADAVEMAERAHVARDGAVEAFKAAVAAAKKARDTLARAQGAVRFCEGIPTTKGYDQASADAVNLNRETSKDRIESDPFDIAVARAMAVVDPPKPRTHNAATRTASTVESRRAAALQACVSNDTAKGWHPPPFGPTEHREGTAARCVYETPRF